MAQQIWLKPSCITLVECLLTDTYHSDHDHDQQYSLFYLKALLNRFIVRRFHFYCIVLRVNIDDIRSNQQYS